MTKIRRLANTIEYIFTELYCDLKFQVEHTFKHLTERLLTRERRLNRSIPKILKVFMMLIESHSQSEALGIQLFKCLFKPGQDLAFKEKNYIGFIKSSGKMLKQVPHDTLFMEGLLCFP